MAEHGPSGGQDWNRGLFAWFARNAVLGNLILILLLVGGALSLIRLELEVFPQIEPRLVTVRVAYPGGSPQEVEEGICRRIEEAVADIEGIREIRSTATANFGSVALEVSEWADQDRVLEDVRRAVEQIEAFPPQAEEPVVAEARFRLKVLDLLLYGEASPGGRQVLKETAQRIKEDLIQSGQISLIELVGISPYEISIELKPLAQQRYGVTAAEVAQAVHQQSVDLPAGSMTSEAQELMIRTLGQAHRGEEFAALPLRTLPDGTVLRIGDVAQVVDGFEDDDFVVRVNGPGYQGGGAGDLGPPAVMLRVFRVGGEGAFNIASTVDRYLELNRDALPEGILIETMDRLTVPLRERIGVLLRDGTLGLVLVLLILGLFLEPRVALWAAVGLVTSFVGALVFLPVFDITINMISLFAFILVLGIVVDDVIIVGENMYAHYRMGKSRLHASIDGVREVARPVTLMVASTVIAFVPLLFVTGDAGQVMRAIPIVVIATLAISLTHALLILPSQLAGSTSREHRQTWQQLAQRRTWKVARVRRRIGDAMQWLADEPYRRSVRFAVTTRYVTVAAGLALLLVTAGFVGGGFIEWRFFPSVDSQTIRVGIEMQPGASAAQTSQVVRQVAAAIQELEAEVQEDGSPPFIRLVKSTTGGQPYAAEIMELRGEPAPRAGRLGEVVVELRPGRERALHSEEISRRWRQHVGELTGVRALLFQALAMEMGRPVEITLSAERFEDAVTAAERVKAELHSFVGVHSITDDHIRGNPQIEILQLTELGQSLGLTRRGLAEQVRAAFFGMEAQRVQRERDEVRVFVRQDQQAHATLDDFGAMRIQLTGEEPGNDAGVVNVPLDHVAVWRLGEGAGEIRRVDRRRAVTVTADVDPQLANANDINGILRNELLPQLEREIPRLRWQAGGEQEEQAQAMGNLAIFFPMALIGIFGLLAALLRSYVQPLIIMAAIAFGAIGAVWGHVLMGLWRDMPLSLISVFGIVALAGVVVNDSLILIDLINQYRTRPQLGRRRGADEAALVREAVVSACVRRFRPVVLTTMTAFLGLLPLLLGAGQQTEVLQPMAVSLAFGVLIGSAITLILVPSLYLIHEDARRLLIPIIGDKAAY